MTKIILCRHGQTAWNKEERFRGRKDLPLSEQGLREVEALGEYLADAGVDMIYASPMTRTIQTLTPLAKRLGKEITPLPDVIDMDFGEIEGMSVDEVRENFPGLYDAWVKRPETVTFPGGEGLAHVQARAMIGIERLGLEHPDATIAVASHRVVTKLIMLALLGAGPEKFWSLRQDIACANRFTLGPPYPIVQTINETFHLQKLGGTLKADF